MLSIQELKNPLKLLLSLFNNLYEQFQSRNIPIRYIATAVRVTQQLGVLFDSSCATAAQADTVEHESERT
jgi:hypothetical protein